MTARVFEYGPVSARVSESGRPGWYNVALSDGAGNRFEISVGHFDGLRHMGAARDAIMHLAHAQARPSEYEYRAHVLYTNRTGSEILEAAQEFGWRAAEAARVIEEAQSAAWGRKPELGAAKPPSEQRGELHWDRWFPEFKVPRQVVNLVKGGLLRDTTKCHDASPNFDAVLADGSVLTLWIEHPNSDKRIGQEFRYGITVRHPQDPMSRAVAETNSLDEVLQALQSTLRERGGPRWAG
jgi:hypothetical protein